LEEEQNLRLFLVGGGEPLLHMELVESLVSFAKDYSLHNVGISVVTNGTFGEGTRRWLTNNNVSVRVSFDGVMQETQRPFALGSSSFGLVTHNIESLLSKGVFLIVQSIITNDGLNSMRATADLLHDLGVESWKVEPVQGTSVSRSRRKLEPDPIEYACRLFDCIRYIAESGYAMTLDTGFFGRPSDTHYCGMSVSNRIVTPEGLVTSCVEVARSSDPYTNLVMTGKVKDGILAVDSLRQQRLRELHFSNQLGGCSKCEWRFICGGGCPMANIWRNGYPPLRKSLYTCSVEYWLLPRLLLAIAEEPGIADVVMEHGELEAC